MGATTGEVASGAAEFVALDGGGEIGVGDEADEASAVVGDGDDVAARLAHRVGEIADVGGAVDDRGVGAHGAGDLQGVELRALGLLPHVEAGAAQADVVDGVAREQLGGGGGEGDGGHEREEAVVAGEFEDDEEGGHGGAGGGGKTAAMPTTA